MFNIYVTDCLQAITNMVNKAYGGNGEAITSRYYDIIHPKTPKKEETADDIINRIKKKIGS